MVAAFIEFSESGIEQHVMYDPRVSTERIDGDGILASPAMIPNIFSFQYFFRFLYTRSSNV